jgi:hypothetical protein
MSVSDAIGLLSLRLGRVETFVQQLPPLDAIASSASGTEEVGESMRVVDEAVFTSIVTRLERLEQTSSARDADSLPTPNQNETQNQTQEDSSEVIQLIAESMETLKADLAATKDLLLSLQNFTMQTNQKLVNILLTEGGDVVITDDDVNDVNDVNYGDDGDQTEDSEIVVGSLDLRSFVQSTV